LVDCLGDGAHGNAFLGDSVRARTWGGGVEASDEHPRRVEPVDSRPPVGDVADIGSCPVLAGRLDQPANETVLAAP
jgi:hypothetical protein